MYCLFHHFIVCNFRSPHLSCPVMTAVIVEVSTPRVPSRPCQGEAQYRAARMRAPLSGLLARITLVTPLSPHTASCSTNHLSGDVGWKHGKEFAKCLQMFQTFNFNRQTGAQRTLLSLLSDGILMIVFCVGVKCKRFHWRSVWWSHLHMIMVR